MSHGKPLTFRLARLAHGQRNQLDTWEETSLQEEARKHREVLLPGVDVATAFAMQKKVLVGNTQRGVVHAKRLGHGQQTILEAPESMRHLLEQMQDAEKLQVQADLMLAESGFAVFMHESWSGLHHVVRYFDLIEKNEAPDTPLLEWLVTAGAVSLTVALQAVERFASKTTLGRHAFVLDPEDAARLKMAAEVRQELEAEARARG